ncbi:ClpXP protease specificity-enhancing factor [Glaesserella sp.]|uniref:ClpXP protease specificity-enhancing factor n=1 Tax=Glaesserella sp. TaxID=2094731 RepID=UPI0035A0E26C
MKPLRPYLYHAYYGWIVDNDNTPYLLVNADYADVDVPREFVREGKIILNIAPRSIGQYIVNDEAISFSARFQGMLRDIYIPFGAAEAIYAQETGDGVMFQEEAYYTEQAYRERSEKVSENQAQPKKTVKKKASHLKLVK